MKYYVGIDIGAVSATAALIAAENVPGGDAGMDDVFTPLKSHATTGRIYLSKYRRTRGKPLAAASELLDKIISTIGAENIASLCLTGSGSQLSAAKLEAKKVNEFKAIAAGLATTGYQSRTVFEMGGETSKYIQLSPNDDGTLSIVDYSTNGDCAAGTGAFLDQQAGRLKYAVEDIAGAVMSADRSAQVAGRCSVFAKSDMIHAQQKGYSPAEVLAGLCDAVARNFRSAVVRSHKVEAPVVFIGGLAANSAVVRSIRKVFGLDESQLIVPDAPSHSHIPAIGAAVLAGRDENPAAPLNPDSLQTKSQTARQQFPSTEPLSMDNVVLLRNRAKVHHTGRNGEKIDAYMGIDVGSVSTNVVVIDEDGRVVTEIYTRTLGRPIEVVTDALKQIEAGWAQTLDIRGVGTTGSGRELIGELVGADTVNDEITAHKTGATFVGQTMLGGRTPDTIFEIGGQDSKYISLQDGIVVDFTMNDACAAGTGSFLEERAEELDISIKGEFAELALSSRSPIRLGERCTVFMERDVNSYMQQGAAKRDIVAGLAYSIVYNYINRVVRGRKIGDCIFFQGGTAYNDAVAAAFAAVTGKEIIVPPFNGVIGAIGSALLARDKMLARQNGDDSQGVYISNAEPLTLSRFRGYDMSLVDYKLREFTCNGCSNACSIQEFDVEGEKTYWGDKCSDRFRKRTKSREKPVIEDLFALREKLLLDESNLPPVSPNAPTVGIPRAMFALEWLPFWRTFFAHCGMRTVLSDPTNKKIIQAGLDCTVAEPCFPIIAAHGHIADLAARDDLNYIFVPNIISMETRWMHTESYLCLWHQTLPFVTARSPKLESYAHKFLRPQVRYREGRKILAKNLGKYFAKIGISRKTVSTATAAAFDAQDNFNAELLSAGKQALDTLTRTNRPGLVIAGRPYNVHDAGINLSVAGKLRDLYGVNCIPIDFLDTDGVDIRDVNDNMYWNLGRKILAGAKIVSQFPNLHILHITNFKCGPDSFIKHFIQQASGKPFLTLQFDGHSNDAGIMTRCEAYLDSKGFLRPIKTANSERQMLNAQ